MKSGAVAWHDVECASYGADLPLWRELAAERGGPVLDLGCGTGRVALDLAAAGHEVTALDCDSELVAELAHRARGLGLGSAVDALVGDARSFSLAKRFALIIGPMQVAQLLGGPTGRRGALERARDHLTPGAAVALALADPFEAVPAGDSLPPLPDVREQDGWVLSSRPLAVRPEKGGVAVDRLRQLVSPGGELSEQLYTVRLDSVSADELEREAESVGLRPAGRRAVESTADHVGSTVVVLESPRS